MVLAAPVIIKSPKLFRIDEVNSCVYVRVQARKKCSAKIALNYLFVQSISSFVVGKWLLREKCRDPGEFFGIILFGFENISTYTSNFSLHLSKVQLIKLRKQTHCASYMLTESTVKEFEYQL